MSDEDYRDLVLAHDKHIDKLANSIEHIAGAMGSTNRKLEDVINVISTQNVLMEKFTNLEINLKESFNRVHEKIKNVEDTQNKTGCSGLITTINRVKSLESNQSKVAWIVLSAVIIAVLGTVIVKAV